ncbi:MAG: EAL domain-containing protein [Burkholderiales bacterium]
MAYDLVTAYLRRLPRGAHPAHPLHRTADDRVVGTFHAAELSSVFQPVRGRDGAIVGHAAYVRCHGNGAAELSPWQVFALAASDDELVRLDRLCRTVHAINYFASAAEEWRLHLAVEHRLLSAVPDAHGRAFERVLRGLGIQTRRVVIDLPEAANAHPALLAHVIANYRYRGYKVAVRSRGGVAAVEQVSFFRPDVVRLDARDFARDGLAEVVQCVHAAGAQALVEFIETSARLSSAQSAGADLVQGFTVRRPDTELERAPLSADQGGALWFDGGALLI